MNDILTPLIIFAFAGSASPGPNNLMVAASGITFGWVRSIPHILGVVIGFNVMVAIFGLGLAGMFKTYPQAHQFLRFGGSGYLLYLAWRIARAGDTGAKISVRQPLSFFEAALFQWLNPKAWTIALGVITAFTTAHGNFANELATIIIIFTCINLCSLIAWCFFGVKIRSFLASPRALRTINLCMGALVALSVLTLFV